MYSDRKAFFISLLTELNYSKKEAVILAEIALLTFSSSTATFRGLEQHQAAKTSA